MTLEEKHLPDSRRLMIAITLLDAAFADVFEMVADDEDDSDMVYFTGLRDGLMKTLKGEVMVALLKEAKEEAADD